MPRDKNIFTLNPTSLDMKRSVFSRNSQHKTSFNLGELIPIYLDEILPGDTVSLDLAQVIRMSTPIAPIMDNLYCDVYAFFVPNRLVWSNWQQFCGEADTMAWTQTGTYTIPMHQIGQTSNDNMSPGCIGDYFGLPVRGGALRDATYKKPDNLEVSELPLRAYWKIYNDWFRDENNIAPVIYTIGNNPNTNIKYMDTPAKVSRFHDLFSSCLPGPQKGGSVSIPLGITAPVIAGAFHDLGSNNEGLVVGTRTSGGNTMWTTGNAYALKLAGTSATGNRSAQPIVDLDATSPGVPTTSGYINATNLEADLRNATAATINQLRLAFQVQKLLEKDARGGTRYIELLRAHFGVTSPDARLQRSEYLAGHRFRINVDQVLATADSGASGSTDLGQTGAFSKTAQAGSLFTKSFVEHGMLLMFAVIRQDHTYSQGLDKFWLKKERFDFYYPVLANIGEVPVYKSEINVYASTGAGAGQVPAGVGSGVFGYQEAWYEYRFKPSRCTAYLNPIVSNSLNYWTLGDVYAGAPGLNQTFLEEKPDFLDRALKVAHSSSTHQFIADFYFKAKFGRVMPLYSVPGLIDHH